MTDVLNAVWIALAVGFAGFAGGVAFAVSRGFRLWRAFRRTSGKATRSVEELTAKTTAVEEKAAAASAGSVKLAEALERLQESLAVLAVLRAAFAEATSGVDRVRSVVPRK